MSSKLFNYYFVFGAVYGGFRSNYFLKRVNDMTVTEEGIKYHPPTTSTFILYTLMQGCISQAFWPYIVLQDIGLYEKHKMGIREKTPPFPFDSLKWRE